jgi:hypothetical protein
MGLNEMTVAVKASVAARKQISVLCDAIEIMKGYWD